MAAGFADITTSLALKMSSRIRAVGLVQAAPAATVGMLGSSSSARRTRSSARIIVFRSWMSCRLTSSIRFSSTISFETRMPSAFLIA